MQQAHDKLATVDLKKHAWLGTHIFPVAPTPYLPAFLPQTPFPGNSKPMLYGLLSGELPVEISFGFSSKLCFSAPKNIL
jgi:hypothetical protein